jgi:hypothetical protein
MQAPCISRCVGGGWLIRNAGYFGSDQSWTELHQARNSDHLHVLDAPTGRSSHATWEISEDKALTTGSHDALAQR